MRSFALATTGGWTRAIYWDGFARNYRSTLVTKMTVVVVRSTPSNNPTSSISLLSCALSSVSSMAMISYSPLIAWIACSYGSAPSAANGNALAARIVCEATGSTD